MQMKMKMKMIKMYRKHASPKSREYKAAKVEREKEGGTKKYCAFKP